ncbi:hypothetical protein KI387_039732, partial [Taxus chinensis]
GTGAVVTGAAYCCTDTDRCLIGVASLGTGTSIGTASSTGTGTTSGTGTATGTST